MGWKNIKEHYRIEHMVHVRGGEIWIGSGYVPDLIVVTTDFRVTRPHDIGMGDDDLNRYCEEMEKDPEKLKRLVESPDTFEKSVTVYTYDGGDIVEKQCEEPGWPNVTHDGRMMYDNTFSTDRDVVIRWAIENAEAGISLAKSAIEQNKSQLAKSEGWLRESESNLAKLTEQHVR